MYQKISISFSYSIFLPIFVTSDNIALSEVTKKRHTHETGRKGSNNN